ncbi:hypothetical protein [Actinomadura sp. HBU206391]|uniref:hypothetical protein n=1 Tax=Actinomadura sp. HBU206391 TaxID=2731692 RepID=UPI001650AA6E|nr:hypothetical protein [Actinomadura sp. HBU206391]MBC6460055.1 hypothetical protein [Actinomadura sp. HBU206391]
MMKSLGKQALAVAAVVTLGNVGAFQAHAGATGFSAGYTCRLPVLGTKPVTINGTLTTSPSRMTTGTPTRFRLHISSPGLRSPVPIESWNITAAIEVTGAQTASFRMTGSGGLIPARQPITADLAGVWTPRARGTHRLRGGNVTIRANVSRLGNVTVPCVPKEPRPVIATLVVTSPHGTGR